MLFLDILKNHTCLLLSFLGISPNQDFYFRLYTVISSKNRQSALLPVEDSETLIHVGNTQVSRGFPAGIVIGL